MPCLSLRLLAGSLVLVTALAARADEAEDVGNPEKKIKEYGAAVEKSPDDADLWINLGLAHSKAKNPAEAAKAFARAVELKAGDARAHYWLGRALADQKKTSEAITHFAEAARLETPEAGEEASTMYVDAQSRLGKAYMDAEKWDDSIAAYKAALGGKPADPAPFYNQLGAAYLMKGDAKTAMSWLEKTAEAAPSSPATYYNLGFAYRKMAYKGGDNRAALWARSAEMFTKYLSMTKDDALAQFYVGEGLALAGRNAEALPYIERYLAADPGGKKAIAKFGADGKDAIYGAALEYQQALKK